MTSNVSKEDQLRDYLLGRLSESEQKRLERRLLLEDRLFQMGETLAQGPEERTALEDELRSFEGASDEEVEEREQAVRGELFDAYARGDLGAEDRQWVRQLAAGSDQDRERLAFAGTLAGNQEEEDRKVAGEAPKVAGRIGVWQSAAGIAATVVLVSGVFSLFLSGIPTTSAKLQAALEGGIKLALTQSQTVVEVLWTNVRGDEISPSPLSIPRTAVKLDFRLHLPPSADDYTTFDVTLRGRDEQLLDTLSKISKNPDQNLHFQLAADRFPSGSYAFQVFGVRGDGERKDLGDTQVLIDRH